MANVIKLRKGLDINLKGKAAAEVMAVKEPGFYALCPDDFTGVTPKVVVKEQEYVLAAKTLGAKDFYIIFKEILPNIFGQIIIESMFSIPNAIFTEAYLSFVGVGVPEPTASLGSLISSGYNSMITYPHMLMIPVVVLALLMLSFNLLADGLRDAFDPKMQNK